MARRVNTKFVVLMTAVIVVLVGGAVLMALKVQKTFDEHMAMGDEALAEAEASLSAGDDEAANAYYRIAWQHYDNAYGDDPTRIDVLYVAVDVFRKYGCTNVTEAKNQLDEIVVHYQNAYAHNNATAEERQRYLDLLMGYHRQNLLKDGSLPWVSMINGEVDSDVRDDPTDHLARRYLAITGALMFRADLRETEIADIRQNLDVALEHAPGDAELLAYRALFELQQANRARQAEGFVGDDDQVSAEVRAYYEQAADYLRQAFAVADCPPYVTLDALQFALSIPATWVDRAELVAVFEPLIDKLAKDAEARKGLTAPELIGLFRVSVSLAQAQESAAAPAVPAVPGAEAGVAAPGAPGEGAGVSAAAVPEVAEVPAASAGSKLMDRARAVVAAAVKDNPEQSPYRMSYAQVLFWSGKYGEAAEQIKAGLAIERRRNAEQYLLNLNARIGLTELSIQTAIARAGSTQDFDERAAQLQVARDALKAFREAEGGASDINEATADYYAGRISMIEGDYHNADRWLSSANRRFNQRHYDTLVMLGDTAVSLENFGKAASSYERAVQLRNDQITRIKLIQVCLAVGGELLPRAIELIERYNQDYPTDSRGFMLRAQALAATGNPAEAVRLIEQLDIKANPSYVPILAGYLRQADENDRAIQVLRDRLADEPNDTTALRLLLNMLETAELRVAEIDRLEQAGMDGQQAESLRQVYRLSGSTNPQDQEELIRLGTDDPVLTALTLFQLFENRGETEKAQQALDQAAKLDPNHPGVLEQLFFRALRDGKRDEANRVIDRLMALPPNKRPRFAGDRDMLRTMAEASYQLQQGQINDATRQDLVARYRKALANDPNMVDGWLQLTQLLAQGNQWPQARDAALKAYELQPNNVRVLVIYCQTLANNGDLPTAMRVLENALRTNQNALLRRQYLALAQQGGYTNILLSEMQRQREQKPDDYNNRRSLADLYLQSNRPDEALEEIDAVIAAEGPTLASTWIKARTLVALEQTDAARQFVQQYVTGRGSEVTATDHLLLARVQLLTGQLEAAMSAYEAAAALDTSDNHAAGRDFAALLTQTGHPVQAAALFRELVQQHPDEDVLKIALAQTLLMSGALEQARAAMQGMPESVETQLLRYEIAVRENQPEQARELLASTYAKHPQDNRVALPYARLLLSAGQTEQAAPVVRGLVERAGSNTDVQMVLAQLELQQGNRESAQARLSTLVQNAPSYFPAREALFMLLRQQSESLAMVNPARALEVARQAMDAIAPLADANPQNLSANLLAGQAASFARQADRAVIYFERAYQIDGGPAQLTLLARALITAEQHQKAIDLLRAPENASALNQSIELTGLWARALAGAGKTDQAVNLFTGLLKDNRDMNVRVSVVGLILASFAPDKAIEVIDTALGNERFGPIDYQITQLLSQLERWDDVLDRLNRYESSPTGAQDIQRTITSQIALASQQTGDYERAKRLYERVLADEPDNINVLNNLAYMLCDNLPGYEQEGLKYAERAVAALEKLEYDTSEQSRALVLDTLGWAQYRAGQPDKAIATLEKSIALQKLHANVVHLARVYIGLDNKNRALRLLDDAAAAARRANNQAQLDEIAQLKEELNR